MPDIPMPPRRPGRPKGSRNKPRQRAAPTSLAYLRQQQSQNAPLPPATFGGDPSLASEDIPPLDRQGQTAYGAAADVGEPDMPDTFSGYRGKYGTLKTNIVGTYGMVGMAVGFGNPADGAVIAQYAEKCADAWITLGKSDPRVMRVLLIVWGNPMMLVIAAHMPIAFAIMANHGISPLKMLVPINLPIKEALSQNSPGAPAPASAPAETPEVPPLPYEPVGAFAPTEDAGPPPTLPVDDGIRVLPDMELPADVEVMIRRASVGQPAGTYETLRQQAILQLQQFYMSQNGKVYQPGALGQQVMKE